MKRLVWPLLAVFCIALVQAEPVVGLAAKAKSCCCCKIPGACGMPGCCPAPAAVPAAINSGQSARVSAIPTLRKAQPIPAAASIFYLSFLEPAAACRPLPASAEAAPAARVPLFKAHCSFLI